MPDIEQIKCCVELGKLSDQTLSVCKATSQRMANFLKGAIYKNYLAYFPITKAKRAVAVDALSTAVSCPHDTHL